MNDNQICTYCDEIRDTVLKQLYKIQNQRKEISMLHKKCKSQKAELERIHRHTEMYHEVKAEAVKEFAERLKEHKIDVDVSFGYGKEVYTEAVAVIEIDNLVKEMVGAESG